MIGQSAYKLVLFEAQSKHVSARLINDDETRCVHLHSLVKPEEESKYFASAKIWGDKLVCLGTGLGYHLRELELKCVKDILLIDYYEECIAYSKEYLIRNSGKNIFTISAQTPNPESILQTFSAESGVVQVLKHPPSYAANKSFYDNMMTNINLKRKKTGNEPRNVLILYGSFFLQEELKNAVKANNLNPILFYLSRDMGIVEYEAVLQELLQTAKPDLILSVNMLGFDGCGIIGELASRSGIPLGIWFVDDPRPILLHQRQFIKSSMFAFCWERAYLPYLRSCGFSEVKYLPLATDPSMFSYSGEHGSNVKLGFVGSSMGAKFLQGIEAKFMWRSELKPYAEKIACQMLEGGPIGSIDEIDLMCDRNSVSVLFKDERNRTWWHSYIIHTASMIKRKRVIDSLVPMGIELFGDADGWKGTLQQMPVCHADVDYRHDLASVYRRVDININITSCQMFTAVNQRVFDIPACGGFVITDLQPDLKELFRPDEIVLYSSIAELEEKIRFYQDHDAERSALSARARKTILESHTYYHRLRDIMNTIFTGKVIL